MIVQRHTLPKYVGILFARLGTILLIGVMCLNVSARAQESQRFAWLPLITSPELPSVYWGVAIQGVPTDMTKLYAFEDKVKKRVSIVHWGHPWAVNGAYREFLEGEYTNLRAHGAIPMISWASWDSSVGGSQPEYQLRDIYQGKHDPFIRQWANDAKAWRYPLFLRFNHEMNGWWFPWSEQLNGNQPGDFVKAWRHVHDIFAQVGASNVTWVWCVNATGYPQLTPPEQLYPGDAYVDWVAIDGYNFGADGTDGWKTFSQVFKRMYGEIITIAPNKPIMIAEIASSEDGGPLGRPDSKAAWIADAFAVQLPQNFPKIKAVVWFNSNVSNSTREWPIESSQASIAAFSSALGSGYYSANEFADLSTSPIAPLTP